ncbi:alpha/beta hydrolase [Nocardia veterana]|uniref:Esterase family protein n=1 Tax=Nocardia veterana TaxID=132249 RepID=A0A7X6M350_9NOCA|nr:alpha/beta hydrolase family protein [Nocardia veterana]NKY89312.1 esterase family protein [Nocardia veterana]
MDRRTQLAALLATALTAAVFAAPAVADEPPPTPVPVAAVTAAARPAADGAQLIAVDEDAGGMLNLRVHSAAMDREIGVKVLRAPDGSAPAPVLYLLNGASGGSESSSWPEQTDIVDFFRDKQVTVVTPMGGNGSYFADWRADDPVLGRQRWATFLTAELPPIIDSAFHGSGAAAVAGISMAGTSVFQLALAAPGRYRAVGSYSGCARTSDPLGQAYVDGVVLRWHGDPLNLWGPPTDPLWAAHDPYVNAERLRGVAIYVATGTGIPGPFDTPDGPGIHGNTRKLAEQLVYGGILEAATHNCAVALRERLNGLNIPATFDLRPVGTHSWAYWQEDLHRSWPLFEQALTG